MRSFTDSRVAGSGSVASGGSCSEVRKPIERESVDVDRLRERVSESVGSAAKARDDQIRSQSSRRLPERVIMRVLRLHNSHH